MSSLPAGPLLFDAGITSGFGLAEEKNTSGSGGASASLRLWCEPLEILVDFPASHRYSTFVCGCLLSSLARARYSFEFR
jgi:hypothetical protein